MSVTPAAWFCICRFFALFFNARQHKKEAHPGTLARHKKPGTSLLRPEDKTEMVSPLPTNTKNNHMPKVCINVSFMVALKIQQDSSFFLLEIESCKKIETAKLMRLPTFVSTRYAKMLETSVPTTPCFEYHNFQLS